ncbi:leucyl aminopeptidase [Polymorphum gilvum]|uniref:Probable cytosol aminopeptidase n=1 Tax=Polymorphum gilvum (strain LMG 25793 / CGMCC 1.9160 / SL003B-26A1) TaxID=991905 RepID=F2J1L6_POLGS|nr:leucyl aminopeptidase [Polymorphum gilvum]ADZ70817.1 Cytosol aminopeptidase family, catalytic domain [Polymorphum gilvum SL003B-26A1]
MSKLASISFAKPAVPATGIAVVFATEDLKAGPLGSPLLDALTSGFEKVAKAGGFAGKRLSKLDLIAPAGLELDRLIVIGVGKPDDLGEQDWLKLGGTAQAALAAAKASQATVVLDLPDGGEVSPEAAATLATGVRLRSYRFDVYKTKKDDDNGAPDLDLDIVGPDPKAAKKAWAVTAGLADGVCLARDLVNEPPNALGPVEFAERAAKLEKLGVEVEILTEKEMKKLKMAALLGVAQGSRRPPRLAIMRWNGGRKDDAPLAFVGKGVVFDTGGISIKPAAGMEEMKGDMGGAAAVVGLMHALAARKAKANVVGVIGLVENMPDGNAQRPGDIVRAMSGTTIEILNTDAEGRLVLADALWYTQERYKPAFMIDLATLTGAVIVALGNHNAGLYSNNDDLAEHLSEAGEQTGEWVWRMPLGKHYDKLIDTPNADVKNTGGRFAGSITAAQFLQRFTNDLPWAHLDIAGTAFGQPKDEINQGWASGYGVRLLDRLVRNHYEK